MMEAADPSMTVRSVAVSTPIGMLTVIVSAAAVVSVRWAGSTSSDDCCDAADSALLAAARDQLTAYFDGRLTAFDLPLAPTGGSLQRAVWDAMCTIPYGETRHYGELAQAIGATARQIGAACGENPIPIIIPCHRVVAADGRLGGYSGGRGVATKRWLLSHEDRTAFALR